MSFLDSGVCCLGKVLVLLDLCLGLVANILIKREDSELCQPLDYLGVPFKCNRCHVYGDVISECSLSFNCLNRNSSSSKIRVFWHVKNGGVHSGLKPIVLGEISEIPLYASSPSPVVEGLVFGPQTLHLNSLKSLILSPSDDCVIDSFRSWKDPIIVDLFKPSDSFLGDLGFASLLKAKLVSGDGYFLRSC